MFQIAVIETGTDIRSGLAAILNGEQYEITAVFYNQLSEEEILTSLNTVGTIIIDLTENQEKAFDVLKLLKGLKLETDILVLISQKGIKTGFKAIKEGAFFFLEKPLDKKSLLISIENAASRKAIVSESGKMQKEILEKNQYLQDLIESAEKILLNMLPKSFPQSSDFKFSVKYKSTDDVGGDIYDVCDIGDYILAYVADVSNHGILAAVIAVIINSFIHNIQYNYKQGINKRRFPDIVYDLSEELRINSAQSVFATLFIVFIDKKTRGMYFVSAGHIDQLLLKADGNMIPLKSTGTILGVFDDAEYRCTVMQLDEGDRLLLFTDGIVECERNEENYGHEGLKRLFSDNSNVMLESMINNIMTDIKEYARNRFNDDITILAIEATKDVR